jgi:hypothetical protein
MDGSGASWSVPPTNSSRSGIDLARQPLIDTIAVRGPIQRIPDLSVRSACSERSFVEGRLVFPMESGVQLRVDSWRGRPEASFEISAPKYLHGSNASPVPLEDALCAVREVAEEASAIVAWIGPVDSLSVTRLDLVRDFLSPGQGDRHLLGLSHIPAVRARTETHQSDDCLGATTVYRKTKRWCGRLYVRGEPHAADRESECVRFELQLRGDRLRHHQVRSVGELAGSVWLGEELRAHFRRSRFDAPVGPFGEKLQLAAESMAQRPLADLRGLIGQLHLDALGVTSPEGNVTVKKYRRWAAESGLTPADVAFHLAPPDGPVRYLDLELGALVAA